MAATAVLQNGVQNAIACKIHTESRTTLSRVEVTQPGHVSSVDAFDVQMIAIVFMNERRCEKGLCSPSLVVNSDRFVPV